MATGAVIGKCYRRHRQQEFLKFLNEIDSHVPGSRVSRSTWSLTIMGRTSAQREAVVRASSRVSPPFHADQRVVAESGGAVLRQDHREADPSRGIPERAALETAIMDYLADHNENPRPFVWTANAELILNRVQRVCERISNSRH